MSSRTMAKVIGVWVFVSLACSSSPGPQTPRVEGGDLSAFATSPVAVRLEWQSIDVASGYQIEARYGEGEFLPVAEVAAGQTSYDHFVVPGSTRLTYRLNAITGAGQREIASASVAMPELAPSPLLVQPMASAPTVSGLPDLAALPTIDPYNPDPNVVATLTAFGDAPTDLEPQTQPVWVRMDIGPEGGIVTLAGPNQVAFTLEVPAGAVDELTTIYLTPIGEISDFPFAGGPLGAVQIHPPIAFHSPLTLTIALPGDQAASSAPVTVGFAVSSFNSELSLAPIYAVGENAYKMNVYWGDTFGLAAATWEEVKTQAGRIPSDYGEQLAQQLAALRAFNTDTSPEGEARIAAQILQGLLQQTQALTAGTSPNGGAVLAAPAPGAGRAPDFQYGDGAKLFASIQESERAWDDRNQTLPRGAPGIPDDPGNQIARSMAQAQAQIVEDITQAIKGFLDEHQGCRTQQDLFAQALLQILINPESDFQRQIADNYRSQFGAPESKKECTYQLHIVQSTIEGEVPAPGGILTLTETVSAHANPISLEMVVRGGRLSLRGVGPVAYDQYELFDSSCPPPVDVTPYPSVAIWITDLMPIFDPEGRVSNFALQGVIPDPVSSGNVGELTVREDEQSGRCTMIRYVPPGGLPDLWGWWFAGAHNPYINTDNWSIVGDDSYVATSTVTNWTWSYYTESTTMILTVNQTGQ